MALHQRGALAHECCRRPEFPWILIAGRALAEDRHRTVIEQVLNVARRLPRKIGADHSAQVKIDRVHRVVHIHADRNVVVSEELDNRQGLIRWTVRVRFLTPFELAVEKVPIHVEVDLGRAVTDSRRRQLGFRGVGRFDNGIGHCLGRRGAATSQSQGVRTVGMCRRDNEVLRGASGGFGRPCRCVVHDLICRAAQIESDEHCARIAVVDNDGAGEQTIADRIRGDG